MAFDLVHRVLYEWDLKSTDKLVMLVLAEHANEDHGWRCHPSIARMCRATGSSRNTVKAALKRLEDDGCIITLSNGGGRVSTQYQVDPEWTGGDVRGHNRTDRGGQKLTPPVNYEGCQDSPPGGQPLTLRGSEIDPEPVIEPVKETVIPKPPPKMDEAQTIQGLWNEVAERHGLTKWVKVTKWHEKQAKDRVKEHGWDGIRKALSVIDSDPFYQSSEARGWCDIRYFLRPGGRKEQPIVLLLEKADRPKGGFGDRDDDAPLWKQVAEREKAAGGMR